MARRSATIDPILEILSEKGSMAPSALKTGLDSEYGKNVSLQTVSYTLKRLWERGNILRSIQPVVNSNGKKEFIYARRQGRSEEPVDIAVEGKPTIALVKYKPEYVSKVRTKNARGVIKQIFEKQSEPEPLFMGEIAKKVSEDGRGLSKQTLASTLSRMVFERGEMFRSGYKFYDGYLYHPDSRVIERWIQEPPHKGLEADEKGMLQLIRERTVITTKEIRRLATQGRNLPDSYSSIEHKVRKLKELIPWVRTEVYGSTTLICDGKANSEVLKDKLERVKFWLSEEGKVKRAIGLEFQDFGKHIFYDVVHGNSEWSSTAVSAELGKMGRFGEYDLLIEHTFGPIEFTLRETLVFEFKLGMISWKDLFGYNAKHHSWGFLDKLEEEQRHGIFRGKFVRPIVVAAHTIEGGLGGEVRKRGGSVIFMSDLLDYLSRKGIDPESVLKAVGAKHYKLKR
jgi:hypothetical protein